jgi:small-conductance mechanosensitive channel
MRVRLLLAAIFSSLLWSQDSGAPVTIDGKEVARVYGPLGSFTARDRADAIEERIIALAKRGFNTKLEIRQVPSENATAVVAGPAILMAVTDMDAQPAGVARDELARRYAAAIETEIESYRKRHSWTSFVMSIVKTLAAWALYCMFAWALWRSLRWVTVRSRDWLARMEAERSTLGIPHLVWERSRAIILSVVKLGAGLFLLSLFSFVVSFTFGLFPQTAGISTTLMDYLGSAFGRVGLAILGYLPSGGFVIVVCVLVHYILKILKFGVKAIERGDLVVTGLHPEMAKPTYQLLRFVAVVFAMVVVFPYLPGGQSEAFKGVSIFLGVLLSLGSSSAVSNVLAGLVLTYMRPFHTGDRVKIADCAGDVLEKTLLVTRIRTIKNVEVVIPNAAILGTQILNYSALARSRGLILNTTVTIGYDAPWRTVHNLLIRAALRTEGVLTDPMPFVLETSLNDFHISYELNSYTDRANEMQDIYSRLHAAIQDSFNEAGVEIMSPTFYALRDGNSVTIPADHRPVDYETPAFRIKTVNARRETPAGYSTATD